MSDDPFYSPNWNPPPARRYRPKVTEPLWELRKDHVTWNCDLRFHGESYAQQAMIRRNGELHISQRFVMKEYAIQWAESERADIEKGWCDGDI